MEKNDRLVLILLIGGVLVLLMWMIRSASNFPGDGSPLPRYGLGPGEIAPPIRAAGWLNGDPPTAEELQGKVVVVDSWAYWCGPCLQAAPELIAVYEQYRDQDVVFVGLTDEPAQYLPHMQKFIEKSGIPWTNGYGARETLMEFGADVLPAVWVVGRDGNVVWNSGMAYHESMESALDRALAAPVASRKIDQPPPQPATK